MRDASRPASSGASWPGLLAALIVTLPALIALGGLMIAGNGFDLGALAQPYIQRVIVFSGLQAALSTLISLVAGGVIALALARCRDFPGRSLFLALLATTTVLPSIVVVFAIVAV